jgi:pimeloyl-ACP methyl ester carboxylesterase
VIARHIHMAAQRTGFSGTDQDFAAAMRSVVATAGGPRSRFYRQRIRSITRPVLLIHGTLDRLVPIAAARAAARANPSWSLREFPGVGHVPQLEVPERTAAEVTAWLTAAGWSAARSAATA